MGKFRQFTIADCNYLGRSGQIGLRSEWRRHGLDGASTDSRHALYIGSTCPRQKLDIRSTFARHFLDSFQRVLSSLSSENGGNPGNFYNHHAIQPDIRG
jgi:hypothetical protein